MTLHVAMRRHIVDVELDISTRGVTVLFGPSGAGKTTILRAIAGLDALDSGRIVMDGALWNDGPRIVVPARRRDLGYLFQDHALFPHLGVRANVGYGIKRRASADDVQRALHIAKADHLIHTKVVDLSGGEAQRVALARALAHRPRMLLLDEPLSALDAPTRAAMRTELRSVFVEHGIPAIVVTHDRTEALMLADTIAVIVDGQVRQVGAPAEVFDRPADPAVARILGVETVLPGRIASQGDGVMRLDVAGTQLSASGTSDAAPGAEVLVCIRAEDIAISVSTEAERSSQRNRVAAIIRGITAEGPLVRVDLDAGFGLAAYITRPAVEDLELTIGSRVHALFKSQAVHVIPR